jgi:large subunit ribosomal protein L25
MSGSTLLAQLAVQRFRERALLSLPRAGRAELTAFRRPAVPTVAGAEGAPAPSPRPKRAPAFELANPFLPTKAGSHWRAPVYSLRRQAALVAAARALGPEALALLPPGPKLRTPAPEPTSAPAWADVQVTWTGPEVPEKTGPSAGRAYSGRKRAFKGHKWERVLRKTQKHRHILLKDMAKRIRRYKNVRALIMCELGTSADEGVRSITSGGSRTRSSRARRSSNRSCRSRLSALYVSVGRNSSSSALHIMLVRKERGTSSEGQEASLHVNDQLPSNPLTTFASRSIPRSAS